MFFIRIVFKWSISKNYQLSTILMKNNYPLNFIDSCIKSFLNKLYTRKVVVPNVPKRNVFVKLPFLGSTSFQIRKKLQKLFRDKLTSCNLKIVFTSPVRVKSFFTFIFDKFFSIIENFIDTSTFIICSDKENFQICELVV